MNITELREILQNALGDINVTIGYEDTPEPSDIEQRDHLIELLAELPDRGTVIIDGKGMTVVPFEVGDEVFRMDEGDVDNRKIIAVDYFAKDDVFLMLDYGYEQDMGLDAVKHTDCFATREDAEAECQRRNSDGRA